MADEVRSIWATSRPLVSQGELQGPGAAGVLGQESSWGPREGSEDHIEMPRPMVLWSERELPGHLGGGAGEAIPGLLTSHHCGQEPWLGKWIFKISSGSLLYQ